jgi:DNA-binding IclR family transcriptional regulator
MGSDGKASPHVQSVARALELLELMAKENREMSLTEISGKMGWPKSTVHGLLATLREYHFVDQSIQTGHYCLGIRLFEFGHIVARNWEIRSVALPQMQQLNRKYGEMVQLATEDRGEVLYIDKLDSKHLMRIVSEIGARLPIHCSALGKVLLAYRSPAEVKWILAKHGMPRMTKRTITDPLEMERELEKIRRQGYSVDEREIMDSLRCVAAPIYDREGAVRYAISISGLADSFCGDYMAAVLQSLIDASNEISFMMGYRGNSEKRNRL